MASCMGRTVVKGDKRAAKLAVWEPVCSRNVRTSQHLLILCNCFPMDIALWKLCATIGIAVKNFGANIMASTFGQAAQGKALGRPPQLALLDSLAELTANFANEHMMELASRLAASLQDT